MKETTLINHIDKSILKVNRRHAKKFGSRLGTQDQSEAETERGYESFKEVVKDIENIVDVVWVSGTRMSLLFQFRKLADALLQLPFRYHI